MVGSESQQRSLSADLWSLASSVVLSSVVITGLIVGLRSQGKLEGLELGAFDYMMRSRADEAPDDRFLIVGITDVDIQQRKEYPIEDGTLATLLEKLEQHQPRVIGIDILRDVKQGSYQGREQLLQQLSQSDRIVATCEMSKAESPGIPAPPGIPEDRIGVADFPVDAGGTVRQGILITTPETSKIPNPVQHICNYVNTENQLPSLSFQMVIRYLEPMKIEPQLSPSGLQFGSTQIKRLATDAGGYHQADTRDFRLLLNYRSAKNAVKQVSLGDVLDNKVDPALIKDKIVMIGYTAAIVKDTFYTPYSAGAVDGQKMPGVVVHAQNASQILSAVLDNRPLFWYCQKWQEGLWIFIWAVIGGILAGKIRQPWVLILSGGLVSVVLVGSTYLAFISAGWIPVVPPLLGLLATGTSVVLIDRYAATIVKNVKGLLSIKIDIDESKKEEEVSAIIQSDFFMGLEQKAEKIRSLELKEDESSGIAQIIPPPTIPTGNDVSSTPRTRLLDTLKDLEQDSDSDHQGNTLIPELMITEADDENEGEIDYLERLQQRSKKMRKDDN
ncbi:MAG: CHASE2 domain-containing protein [Cuspidothrix sp.]